VCNMSTTAEKTSKNLRGILFCCILYICICNCLIRHNSDTVIRWPLWRSGNGVRRITVVKLHQARLVQRLVTIVRSTIPLFVPATRAHSAWLSLRVQTQWVLAMVLATAGEETASPVFRSCWACYRDSWHTVLLSADVFGSNPWRSKV